MLKLDILSNLASETNVGAVLKELQFYVYDRDKRFVCAAIQALGRCAARLPELAERCMRVFMTLVANQTEVRRSRLTLSARDHTKTRRGRRLW
jgi:AP-3 complex subunit beta